ncbi:serine/threonine-protein phosphatase 4 regulatory subunit 2 [Wyeomyia smithii]|uniref:serine/threonine-protein phosphatase 4 regulatory subunit 2 n=1 Tax=Wyeomyia smithii TaxID=174621 RepID=UPI002467D459|nr:serine/threonine-protein phosphatase 4 regulatory subunit 2 [Wyeomyia smithii]
MENPEEVLQLLERFTKLKQKEIPRELDDYLSFVARTGDTVYRWAVVKHLFREKLLHVITDFHDNTPRLAGLPQCPNVDPFNYHRMRQTLVDRLDAFNSAPFTVQRICELLTEPRKQYTRIDKFMRAVEKNILVVSTQEPGRRRYDSENGDSLDSTVNGDDVCVDIEMDNEAFGIDSGEMVANSTSSSASTSSSPASASSSSSSSPPSSTITTTATTATTPTTVVATAAVKDDESTDEVTLTAVIETQKEDKTEAENVSDASVALANSEDSLADHPSSDVPDTEETIGEKSVPKEQNPAAVQNDPEEKSKDATQLQEGKTDDEPKIDAVDAIAPPTEAKPESAELILKEPTAEVPSTVESRSPDDNLGEQSTTISSTPDDPIDDGQPLAKQAKLSVENLPSQKTTVAPEETTEPKDDLNADSSESLESDACSINLDLSPMPSAQNLTSNLTESLETVVHLAEIVQTEEPQEAIVEVVPNDPEPVMTESELETEAVVPIPEVTLDENPTQAIELPTEASIITSDETIPKPAVDEQQQSTVTLSAASDEMETAVFAPLMAAENVMATDEEETSNSNATASDAVVPMAADVVSDALTKSDDNAMDVDESSVEPMDQ